MVFESARKSLKDRKLRKPRHYFDLAVSVNFLYTISSLLITTFGIYFLGRPKAAEPFSVVNSYLLTYVSICVLALSVVATCLMLAYRLRASVRCHAFFLALVPVAQTADHALFAYVAAASYLASQGDGDAWKSLYAPISNDGNPSRKEAGTESLSTFFAPFTTCHNVLYSTVHNL